MNNGKIGILSYIIALCEQGRISSTYIIIDEWTAADRKAAEFLQKKILKFDI